VINIESKQIEVIHHGVSNRFNGQVKQQQSISDYSFSRPFKFIYVSTVHTYKNQCNVVEAIGRLREKNYPVELNLVGGVIFEPAGKKLDIAIKKIDPNNKFIHYHGHISYEKIDAYYKMADGIIFASTCENMPNILIESMASGIPIACSKKQPMPEFLNENGFYFDAHQIDSIVESLIEFLDSPHKREANAINALKDASKYSWVNTSRKTFEFLISIYQNYKHV
jgi:glycosyltransferase involved in cell wall biosynthesis